MEVTDWIDWVEIINEWLRLISREKENLSKRETIFKVITPNTPRALERDYVSKEGNKAKALKVVKTILTIIEKVHRTDEVEEEPSGKKKLKEPAPNPTDMKLTSTA